MIMYVVATVIVLGVLIMVHELGHFFAAKWVGIRVERFINWKRGVDSAVQFVSDAMYQGGSPPSL